MLGEKQLQESKELMQGKVSMGISTFISNYYLKDSVKKFMKDYPNIVIKMSNHDNDRLYDLIHQHTLDLLIIPDNPGIPKDLNTMKLMEDEYCFAYNKEEFDLPEIKTLEELSQKQLLLPVKTSDRRKKIEELFNNKGLTVDPIMELETNEMMLNYIKEGMGIGYLLKSIAEKESLEIVEVNENLPQETITIVYNELTLTNSTKEFINNLKNNN